MKNQRIKELGLYLVFGVLTTLVSWGSYTVFVHVGIGVFWANLLSWVLAVAFAYITNKLWVFNAKSWELKVVGKELVSFLASRGITGLLEIVSVPLLERLEYDGIFYPLVRSFDLHIKILFTDGIYSKITVSFLIVVLNYIFSKLIVFKRKDANVKDQ